LAAESLREHAQRQDRVASECLAGCECAEQGQRCCAEPERVRRAEPVIRRLHDRVDTEHERRRDEECAQRVGTLADPDPPVTVQQSRRRDGGRDADRKVDEEDPVPAHGLRDQPAGQQANRGPGRGDEAEHSERLRLLVRLREQGDDHGQDHRRADCAADALHEARGDQHRLAEGESAEKGGPNEDGESGEVHALAPEKVAESAGQQEQPAERDEVRVDHPREPRLREPEVTLNRRECDVHDRHVDDDQQEPGAEHDQREPA